MSKQSEQERLAMENTLESLRRELMQTKASHEKVRRLLDRRECDFLHLVHDLRSPSCGIQGLCTLLQQTTLSDLQREQIGIIESTAGEMTALVDRTLELARLEVEEIELQAVPLDLEALMLETLKISAHRAAPKKLQLFHSRTENISRFIQADPVRLKQVLDNLVNNAIKFTDQGYVSISAQMTSSNSEPRLQISVEDSGRGMTEEMQAVIFDRFQTTGSNPEEGTGLGLSICAEIVRQMKGEIHVQSVLGQGTCFQLILPVRQIDEDQSEHRRKSLIGCRLLLVSDYPLSRTTYRRVLTAAGATVTICDSSTLERMIAARAESLSYHALVVDAVNVAAVAEKFDDADNWRSCRRVLLVDGLQARELDSCFASSIVVSKPADYDRLIEAICEGHGATSSFISETAKPMRILLVEDSEVSQMFADGLLSMQGHDVKIVSDGRSAVEAVKATEFDLVLMDIELPEMDGYDAAREIRRWEQPSTSRLPIVAMTAHRDSRRHSDPSTSDMDAWLTKPVDAEQLSELVIRLQTIAPATHRSKLSDQGDSSSAHLEVHPPRDATPGPSRRPAPRPLRRR
ncbi:MAG: ATP-binding protein [Pirellulaceae bacterium]|nr:ATP-binding protein [Pirellulaceae bacterium]